MPTMPSGHGEHGNVARALPECTYEASEHDGQRYFTRHIPRGLSAKQPFDPRIFAGFFSKAKQKIKSVQGNLKTPAETAKPCAQYFSFNSSDQYAKQQYMGYATSHNDLFKTIRKTRRDEFFKTTSQLLLRVELLTSASEHVLPNRNTKERRSRITGNSSFSHSNESPSQNLNRASFGGWKILSHHCVSRARNRLVYQSGSITAVWMERLSAVNALDFFPFPSLVTDHRFTCFSADRDRLLQATLPIHTPRRSPRPRTLFYSNG